MGRRPRPIDPRRALVALLSLALAGCATQFSSRGERNVSAVLLIGILAGASYGPALQTPEMDPSRRVAEQDCTKPIEDPSANLKCR